MALCAVSSPCSCSPPSSQVAARPNTSHWPDATLLEARLAKALSECPIATLVKNREAEQRSALKSAEHLPRVVKLVADDAARLRVWVTLEQDGDFGSARGSKYINSYYRLNLKVYEDAKAIGIRCPRRPIRSRPEQLHA
jgi:hypothetical protein